MLCLAIFLSINLSIAQTSNIYIGNTDQTIRGFGGMNFPRWISDLSTNQIDKAFGTGNGQIGLSILRISISPDQNQWSLEVPTAQRAASYGAIVFGTPWSPPASMKTNSSVVKGELRTDKYSAYANYLRDFYNYMSSNGVNLYAISVQNEPDWLPDYESCGWTGTQIRTFLDNNASVIPTRVIAPETVHYKADYMSAIASSTQVDILANHAYGGSPTRYSTSKEQWMTEHYAPNSDANSANNWPEALEAGKEIHDYLINGYSAYVWWYIRRSYGLITEDGNVSKRGFVMSHYSKYIRPGFVRTRADASPTSGVSVSAYQSGSNIVIVAINQNSSSSNLTLNFSENNVTNITKYETTGATGQNQASVGSYSGGSSLTNTLSGYSISTFVGTIGGDDGGDGSTSIWLEAECGNVGSLWDVNSDGNASNSQYVTVQSGNNSTGSAPTSSSGQISYAFNVSESGTYNLWSRVITPNGNDDSFWLQIDGGSWFQWNNIGPNSSWAWEQAQSYSLSAGSHTLTIAYREDGALLDKLLITNSGITPSGEGSAASNCGSSSDDYMISVRALGTDGSEQLTLSVGGTAVQSWTLSTSMSSYTASTSLSGVITVEFTNDDGSVRDVQIDYIDVAGSVWQAEDQATNTGVWQDGSCGGSYSDWLHCGGYIEFSAYKNAREGIESFADSDMTIFPNPATEQLNIIIPEFKEGLVRIGIYSFTGALVKEVVASNNVVQLSIGDLLPGQYIIKATKDGKSFTKKIIKKR